MDKRIARLERQLFAIKMQELSEGLYGLQYDIDEFIVRLRRLIELRNRCQTRSDQTSYTPLQMPNQQI